MDTPWKNSVRPLKVGDFLSKNVPKVNKKVIFMLWNENYDYIGWMADANSPKNLRQEPYSDPSEIINKLF